MFAVIKTGGKQYRVANDDVLDIRKARGEPGAALTFGEVLMVGGETGVTVGAPVVPGASVASELVEQTRAARSSPSRSGAGRTPSASAVTGSI